MSKSHLQLRAADGRALVYKYYRQTEAAENLLLILPGNHYGIDGPLLYYPNRALREKGWDTFAMVYGFQSAAESFAPEMIPSLIAETGAAISTVLAEREYQRVGLVGKSLGALLAVQLCSTEEMLSTARVAYLTPPLGTPFFDQLLEQTQQPSFLALGTNDRYYSSTALEAIRSRRPFVLTLVEHADHSMNIGGDVRASMEVVRKVSMDVVAFMAGKD
ncbi:MAG: hypothetical protein IIC78_01735 [Chloroflexi bacterium]|nr:hypothetical protein [Chloroflexota bacterium]